MCPLFQPAAGTTRVSGSSPLSSEHEHDGRKCQSTEAYPSPIALRLRLGRLTLTVEYEGPDETILGSIHAVALQGLSAGLHRDVLHAVDGVRRRHTGAEVVGSDAPQQSPGPGVEGAKVPSPEED